MMRHGAAWPGKRLAGAVRALLRLAPAAIEPAGVARAATPARAARRSALPFAVLAGLLALPALPAWAASVRILDGNVVLVDEQGRESPLTSGGADSEPVQSADGRLVAFIRRVAPDGPASGGGSRTELWLVPSNGKNPRRLAATRFSDKPQDNLAEFSNPVFAPDGKTVYFLSAAWSTSTAIHAVDVKTGKERYVSDGNSLQVVPNGQYAGHLLAAKHKYFVGGGSYDFVWLITPQGKELAPVSDGIQQEQIDQFLAR